ENPQHETHAIKIEEAEMPEMDERAEVDGDALKREVEDAESELAESVEGWQRSQADFQNYKRRVERDNEMPFASMKGDIVKKILPVLDDLERALNNRPADDAWANGIELIARKFQNILD